MGWYVPAVTRDPDGHRLFLTQDRAIRAQQRQAERTGIWSAVQLDRETGRFKLLHDANVEEGE